MKEGLFVSRKMQIEKWTEIVFACLPDTTLHVPDGIPEEKLARAISSLRNQMHLEIKLRALPWIRGQDALGVLGEPNFLGKGAGRVPRNLALMGILFPVARVARFIEIEQHEADIV